MAPKSKSKAKPNASNAKDVAKQGAANETSNKPAEIPPAKRRKTSDQKSTAAHACNDPSRGHHPAPAPDLPGPSNAAAADQAAADVTAPAKGSKKQRAATSKAAAKTAAAPAPKPSKRKNQNNTKAANASPDAPTGKRKATAAKPRTAKHLSVKDRRKAAEKASTGGTKKAGDAAEAKGEKCLPTITVPEMGPRKAYAPGQEPYRAYPEIDAMVAAYRQPDLSRDEVRRVQQTQKTFWDSYRQAIISEQARYQEWVDGGKEGPTVSKRPDLVATRVTTAQLKVDNVRRIFRDTKGNPEPTLGHPPGIDINDRSCPLRALLNLLGVHQANIAGIAYMGRARLAKLLAGGPQGEAAADLSAELLRVLESSPTLAVSICHSGGYKDDVDGEKAGEEDADGQGFWYTGAGMNDHLGKKQQTGDQPLSWANMSLVVAYLLGTPVRVTRKNEDEESEYGQVYIYDGLYVVDEYCYKQGKDGYKVWSFHMTRLPGQPERVSGKVEFNMQLKKKREAVLKARPGVVCFDLSRGSARAGSKAVWVYNDVNDELPPHLDKDRDGEWLVKNGRQWVNAPYACAWIDEPLYPEDWPEEERPAAPAVPEEFKKPGLSVEEVAHAYIGSRNADNRLPYGDQKVSRVLIGKFSRNVITECGPWTGCCDERCLGRLIQLGTKYLLEVFMTAGCGWGVRTLEAIPVGAFVIVFAGEMLRAAMLGARDLTYCFDANGRPDVDKDGKAIATEGREAQEARYMVDPKFHGNAARYINHSCEPNLFVQPALVGHTDVHHPWICFFAAKPIPAGSELTYDYGDAYVQTQLGGVCRCGSAVCNFRGGEAQQMEEV